METKNLYLFRIINGKRIRFCFEIDEKFTIISEKPVAVQAPTLVAQGNDELARQAIARHVEDLRNRGHIVEVNSDTGAINITFTPEHEKVIASFFAGQTCDFPGYDTWFQEFKTGMDKLQALAQEGQCTNCDIGAFKRKTRERLTVYLMGLTNELSSTRTGESQGSVEAVPA